MNTSKILIISHEFPPIGGGAGRNLMTLCEELQNRGYNFEIITQKPNSHRLDYPFPIHYITGYRRHIFETSFLSMIIFSIRSLLFVIFRIRGFVTVFSNMAIPAGITGSLISMYFKVPHIIWHHGSDVHGGKEGGVSLLQRIILKAIWRRSDVNCFVSDGLLKTADFIRKQSNAQILPIGVKSAFQIKIQPGIKHYFLFIGRMEPVKNPLAIIEALNLLRTNNKEIPQVRMIGDGSLFALVNQKIESYHFNEIITLEKCVPHDAATDIIANAYSLVITSIIEGFNTTLIEAALLGVPCIGNDVCGINDFITNESTGLLYKNGSIESLAESLHFFYKHPHLRNKTGENAKKKASQFTPAKIADKFEQIFNTLLPNDKKCSKVKIKEN